KLPTLDELELKFKASRATLQKSVDNLRRDRFIESRGHTGTYVTEYPPHLCHYAIAFPHKRGDAASLFFNSMEAAAEEISRRNPCRQFSFYYEIDGHTDREGYRSLLADLQARRLAGLIFATHPGPVSNSPLLARDGVPRIAIRIH